MTTATATARIATVNISGSISETNGNIDGIFVQGTITQENEAGIRFLITSGRAGSVTHFGNAGDEDVTAAQGLLDALEAVLAKQVKSHTKRGKSTLTKEFVSVYEPTLNFKVNAFGATEGDWDLSDQAFDLAGDYGMAVSNYRRKNPDQF